MMIKRMLLVSVLFALVTEGAETTWLGGASGSWSDLPNWTAGVPTEDVVAVFDVSGDVVVTIPSGVNAMLLGLRATGSGSVTFSGGNGLYFGKDANGEAVVDVDEGVTVSGDTAFQCAAKDLKPKFVKTGAGVFNVGNGSGNRNFGKSAGWEFDGVEVRAGELGVKYGNTDSDSFNPGGLAIVHVCAGATLKGDSRNWLVNWGWIDVDEGGTFDACSKNDFIGGFSGAGTVKNVNAYNISLRGGPRTFTGSIQGTSVTLQPAASVASSNSTTFTTTPIDEARWHVGPNAFANVDLTLNNVANPVDYTNAIQFAAGYPAGTVFDIRKIVIDSTRPFSTEDGEGNPITLRTMLNPNGKDNPVTIHFVGKGSLVQSYDSWTYTRGDTLANTGSITLPTSGQSLQLGTGNPVEDAVVVASDIHLENKSSVYLNNTNGVVTPGVSGSGMLIIRYPYTPGTCWEINSLNLTNGDLYAISPYPHYVINGGVSTNVFINSNESSNFVCTVNGGFLHVSNGGFVGEGNRQFYQTGGHVVLDRPISGWLSNGGANSEVFFHMTGGRCESYTRANYGRGLGVELSGNAYLKLRNYRAMTGGGTDYQYHRVSSDGYSHHLILNDDAVVDADQIVFATGGQTTTPPNYHGEIRLNGGTLMAEKIAMQNPSASSFPQGFEGRVYFNGGLLKTTSRSSDMSWFDATWNKGFVGAGGARIETCGDTLRRFTAFYMPLLHDPASEGVDGGLTKTGRGCLVVVGDATYTGPTRVLGGMVRESGASTQGTPFGLGSVELDDGGLLYGGSMADAHIADGEDCSVSYDGVSMIGRYDANSDAAIHLSYGPLVRCNHGVLLLAANLCDNRSTLGSNLTLTTAGGMAVSASGLPVQPIFACAPRSGFLTSTFSFVTYDAERGFVPTTCRTDFAGGVDSLVKISDAAITVAANTQVAGVEMSYVNGENGLVVGNGFTLKIGNDAGYAPILMNSTSKGSNTPGQSIVGGTLDFGAAEGVVVSSPNMSWGWWRANMIKSVIAGTGGVTFAGVAPENNRIDLELHGRNVWTGGTTIESVCVKPMVEGAFSTSPITVHGCAAQGGGIWVPSESAFATLSNTLTLSGNGCNVNEVNINMQESDLGALCVDRAVTVSGAVTLAGATRMSARGHAARLAFTGGVSGTGPLTLAGTGVIDLGAGNAYTGGTVVEGVVECAAADAFGTGPVTVKKGAVLRFVNSGPITLANAVDGDGEIVFAGTGRVDFAGACSFTGAIHGATAYAPDGDFVKNGPGAMSLTTPQTYAGDTVVNAGTLVLGVPPATEEVPFATDVTAHLDVSAPGTVTKAEVDGVTFATGIADADGRDLAWLNQDTATCPQFKAGEINGRDTLFFDNWEDRLAATKSTRVRAVFAVFRTPSGSYPNGYSCVGLFGASGADCGIRLGGSRTFSDDNWSKFGDVWINGVRTRSYAADTVTVGAFMMNVAVEKTTAVGFYWGNASYKSRTWWGDVAEVICYDRVFDDDERQMVERYLASKWGAELPDAPTMANVLPVGSAVTVAAGATIDLAGNDQEFAGLAGAGAVVNTSATVPVATFGSGALDDFEGAFGGELSLRIEGVVTLDPAKIAVGDRVDLVLVNGCRLDLNGGTLTVRNASGNGLVVNGTLVVTGEDRRRDPATVIILR